MEEKLGEHCTREGERQRGQTWSERKRVGDCDTGEYLIWGGASCGVRGEKRTRGGPQPAVQGAPLLSMHELLQGQDGASHRPVASAVPCAE